MTTATAPTDSDLQIRIELDRSFAAPIEAVFEALLAELGPEATDPDFRPLSMKLEAFPGGRWYRDLGDGQGHHWAHVQAIRHPDLLELTGPLFMSLPVVNNVQYRLEPTEGGTLLRLVHAAFGPVPEDVVAGMTEGWGKQLDHLAERLG